MKFAYQAYGEAQSELVKRINQIHDSLVLLTRFIAHGEQFEPSQTLSVDDYKASVINQINALSEMIKAAEFGMEIDHLELTERVAQFSAESLELMNRLKSMQSLPSLNQEREQRDELVDNFEAFAENLSQDPSRAEVLQSLNKTEELQAKINQHIEAARENPLVAIAECWFEGAVAVNELNGPKLKGPSHSI